MMIWRVLVCPMRMLRIKMIEEWESNVNRLLGTYHIAAYLSQPCTQQRFTTAEVAANWHGLMVLQHIMWSPAARGNGQLCNLQTYHHLNQPYQRKKLRALSPGTLFGLTPLMMQTASTTSLTPSGGRCIVRTSTTSFLFRDLRLASAASYSHAGQPLHVHNSPLPCNSNVHMSDCVLIQ